MASATWTRPARRSPMPRRWAGSGRCASRPPGRTSGSRRTRPAISRPQAPIVIRDNLVQPTIRALARVDNDLDPLWCYEQDGGWHVLHSRDVGNYIAARAGGHFTAKEFRTWNATVLMALALANAGPSSTLPGRKRTIAASVREVADWLGDTPAVARGSYIDPRLIGRYGSDGYLPPVPQAPVALPATGEAHTAVAALLAAGTDGAHGPGG